LFSEAFIQDWGYLGVFLWIIATGFPFFPCPEEVPVVLGGVLVGHPDSNLSMPLMLAACILGVVLGDSLLYGLGRLWGPRIVEFAWIKKYVLPPDRLERIERNFHQYGINILLFARLTPGIRAPIFMTAGIVRFPLIKFMIADGIYAIPGVMLLFFLGYWFTDQLNEAFVKEQADRLKPILFLAAILILGIYLVYRFLRKPNVTGDPAEMPPLVEQVTTKIIHRHSDSRPPAAEQRPPLPASLNGEHAETNHEATVEKPDAERTTS
jgi:membrane protein DedA with SNARE-associated domain